MNSSPQNIFHTYWLSNLVFFCPYSSVSALAAGQILERLDKHGKDLSHFLCFLQFFILLSLAWSKAFKAEPHFKCFVLFFFKKNPPSQRVLWRFLYQKRWLLGLLNATGMSVAARGEILLPVHPLLPCLWKDINHLHQENLSWVLKVFLASLTSILSSNTGLYGSLETT